MCGVCGCGGAEAVVEGEAEAEHTHVMADGTVVRHSHAAPAMACLLYTSRRG